MALMHQTTMAPSKLEVIAAWLPTQSWFDGDANKLESLGGYRLDDPAGEVGLEGVLITAGSDTVYHVPMTYRGSLREGGEAALMGTSEHGVLGTRWISDAAGDPVYRAVIAELIATGAPQAEEFVQGADGTQKLRDPAVRIQGSGNPGDQVPNLADATSENVGSRTRVEADLAVLDIVRVVDPTLQAGADQYSLRGTWRDQPNLAVLALLYAA